MGFLTEIILLRGRLRYLSVYSAENYRNRNKKFNNFISVIFIRDVCHILAVIFKTLTDQWKCGCRKLA